jgi:hypothetical protein
MSENEIIDFTVCPEDQQAPSQVETITEHFDEEPQQAPDVDYDDDDYAEGNIVTGKYITPKTKAGTINTLTNEVTEEKDLAPWDVIVSMAKVMNITIQDPKKSCKRCLGRGWAGRDVNTHHPVPCNCIFPVRTPNEKAQDANAGQRMAMANMNRKQRRYMEKANRNMIRRSVKQQQAIENTEVNDDE